jgi:hypothetical protein
MYFGLNSPYRLIWLRAKICKMYIEMINKNSNRWLQYKWDDNDGGAMIPQKRGPRAYPFILIHVIFILRFNSFEISREILK